MSTDINHKVLNTQRKHLDEFPGRVSLDHSDITTAFELVECLLNPMSVLKAKKSERPFASIPLSFLFPKSYRYKDDYCHPYFHEFEDRLFDWILEKAGWKISAQRKIDQSFQINGIPLYLPLSTPRQ